MTTVSTEDLAIRIDTLTNTVNRLSQNLEDATLKKHEKVWISVGFFHLLFLHILLGFPKFFLSFQVLKNRQKDKFPTNRTQQISE